MSAERYEIHDHGSKLTVRDTRYGSEVSMLRVRSYSRELTVMAGAIRQQARDIESLRARVAALELLKQEAIANEIDRDEELQDARADLAAAVAERSEYWGALHSTKDELFECRANQRTLESELRITRDQRDTLRADLAAAVAERDEARTAYQVRNTEWHQHELIAIALAERYKLRAEQAEARLAAIDGAPTVAFLSNTTGDAFNNKILMRQYASHNSVHYVELIARPAKD